MNTNLSIPPSASGEGGQERPGEEPFVLLVDDDEDALATASALFSHRGHRVLIARNFHDALGAIHAPGMESRSVLAFIDKRLGDGPDGIALIKYINEFVPHRVFPYLWTADTTSETSDAAYEAGAISVLKKPIEPAELVSIVEKSDTHRRLRSSAFDSLTSVFSLDTFRTIVEAEMGTAMSRGYPEVFGLILIDVDNFKGYNDTIGYVAANKVLQFFAQFLRKSVRPSDHICRGGSKADEFLILLPNATAAVADHKAEELREGASKLVIQSERTGEIRISISVGSAELTREEITDPAKGFEILWDRADQSMKEGRRERGHQSR